MLTEEQLDRVVVVLVRARNAKNIGAVARAMHDFGFKYLRVVNDYAVPLDTARSAVDASAVIEAAEVFESVAAAVAGCSLVVGTTAVGERALQHRVTVLSGGAEEMQGHLTEQGEEGKVALLFGSEKTGLSNEELSHCQWLLTIPMQEHEDLRHPSMNLGQAVAVCLYELVRGRRVEMDRRPFQALSVEATAASADQVERVVVMLNELLERAGYKRHHPANSELEDIRRLVVRMGLSATDSPVWMGMLRQLLWRIAQTNEQ